MRFYGQFNPPLDQFLYERYFLGFEEPGFFIECGAFDGLTECSCKFFEESLEWKGINIEPAPPVYDLLKTNRPDTLNLNCALSDKNYIAEFKHAVHPDLGENFGNGSLSHHSEHLNHLQDINCTFEYYSVECMTYRDLIEKNQISKVDLFVLDVEGHELSVLEGMKNCPVLPTVFCVEHGHLGIEGIKNAVEPLGYIYDTSLFVNSFFIHQAKLSELLDAKQKFSKRDTNPEQYLKMRITELERHLDEIYKSSSWKLTSPIRQAKNAYLKLKSKSF